MIQESSVLEQDKCSFKNQEKHTCKAHKLCINVSTYSGYFFDYPQSVI